MNKLKQAYETRRDLLSNNNISNLEEILKNDPNIVSTNVYKDNTMYIESNNLDSLINSVEDGVLKWLQQNIAYPIEMAYNILPITQKACIFKI